MPLDSSCTRFAYANRYPPRNSSGRVFARKRFGLRLPIEALQRRAKVFQHGREIARQRIPAAD
jgi:hypothetical protein